MLPRQMWSLQYEKQSLKRLEGVRCEKDSIKLWWGHSKGRCLSVSHGAQA